MPEPQAERPIRYAVVGAGWIAQSAVLPAFHHARRSRLVAIVSSDWTKRRELAERYGIERTYSYEDYDACLRSGEVDAVYIALPNSMHREYTERAARAGVHVLCEKPMAVTEEDCRAMIDATDAAGVKLMIAYRLHFEAANLGAIDTIESGVLGEPRYFESTISQQTVEGIRLDPKLGGGALFDAGVYCVNAARYLLRDEPIEVFGMEARDDERFQGVDETTSAMLRFSRGAIAQITCSLGAAHTSAFRIVGTKGDLLADPAYAFDTERRLVLTADGASSTRVFPPEDQFAPQLDYFGRCIDEDREPEPSGEEGLADVRIMEAIKQSVAKGGPVRVRPVDRRVRPTIDQLMHGGPLETPPLVHATPAAQ